MSTMDLVRTREFRRGDLAPKDGEVFTVPKEVGDFLIKISEVARKATDEERAAWAAKTGAPVDETAAE